MYFFANPLVQSLWFTPNAYPKKRNGWFPIKAILNNRLSQGIIWNYVSLIFLSLAGLLINILVARIYGSEVLGVFNQVFALYIVFSQIAVAGLHFSTLSHVSQYAADFISCQKIISAGAILTSVTSFVTCVVLYLIIPWLAEFLNSPGVQLGVQYALPGLFFFAINKTCISALNGLSMMKHFALVNAARYLLLIVFVLLFWRFNYPHEMLPVIFTCAESVLFLLNTSLLIWTFRKVTMSIGSGWYSKHARFGVKSILSGLLFDINPRVDVILLGHFATDKVVGLYSLAALFAEGFYQLPIVIQRNINPVISRCLSTNSIQDLNKLVRKCKIILVPAMIVVGGISALLYPTVVEYFTGSNDFYSSWPIYVVLIAGIIIASGYTPFAMLLNQAGFPGHFSIFLLGIVLTNVFLNLLLIPIWSMVGAAMATSLTQVLSIYYLKMYSYKVMRIKI